MLTTQDLELLPNYLVNLYNELEEKYIRKLSKDLRKVKSFEQLLNLRYDPNELLNQLSKLSNKSINEISKIFNVGISFSNELNEKFFKALGKKLPPIDKQLINAQILQTQGLCNNITNTMGFIINGQVTPLGKIYQKASDKAYLEVVTGMNSLEGAVDNTMKEIASSGLVFVDYASGYKIRAESAIRRNIVTGVNQTISNIQQTNAQDLGVDKFEVSAHIGARNTGDGWENHEKWQGKVYTMEQLKTICGLGTATGLCGINCRHTYYPFFEGISERSYTDEELKNMSGKEFEFNGKIYRNNYEASQKQRQMERNIRRLKRLELGGIDVTDKLKKQRLLYKEFSNKSGLPMQSNRLKVWTKETALKNPKLPNIVKNKPKKIDIYSFSDKWILNDNVQATTQKMVDYINEHDVAPEFVNFYKKASAYENEIYEVILSERDHRSARKYIRINDLSKNNSEGAYGTNFHELAHHIDNTHASYYYSEKYYEQYKKAVKKDGGIKIGDKVKAKFQETRKIYTEIRNKYVNIYNENIKMNSNMSASKKTELWNNLNLQLDIERRNLGINMLEDIYDAISSGKFRDKGDILYGHGSSYFRNYKENRIIETIANVASLGVVNPKLLELFKEDKPNIYGLIMDIIKELGEK